MLPIYFLRTEGLVIFITAIILYYRFRGSVWLFVLLLLTPDVCIIGYVWGNKVGAVIYNIIHSYVLPLITLMAGIFYGSRLIILLALIWIAHIGMDRLFGFGLKKTTGFKDTHLGRIGQK